MMKIWNLGPNNATGMAPRSGALQNDKNCHPCRAAFHRGRKDVHGRKRASAGLTLIEMIGVMAILSILATMLVPNIIDKIQDAQQQSEDNKLEEIAGALVKGIKAQGKLPDLTLHPTNTNGGWVAMAAPFTVLGTNATWKVYPGGAPGVTNSTARRVYFSSYLKILLETTDTNFGMGWKTNVSSQTITNSVLMFIVSSSKPDLQLSCPTNANISTNEELWLKNWVKAYDNKGNVAATNQNIVGFVEGTSSRWTNRGQFLHVKIVDMAPYLCNVQIEDWHGNLTNTSLPAGASAAQPMTVIPSQVVPTNVLTSSGLNLTWTLIDINSPPDSLSDNSWKNTIQINPITYNAKLDLNYFGSRSGSDRVDGANVWRRWSVSVPGVGGSTFDVVAPAGPFFAIGSGSTNRVSSFAGNPNAAQAGDKRYDKHNLFVIAGTPIKLFQSQENDFPPNIPNLQTVFIPKDPNHTLVYSNGIWITR